jgi:hypothetical protein
MILIICLTSLHKYDGSNLDSSDNIDLRFIVY